MKFFVWQFFLFSLLISGCLEEKDRPEPGKILQTYGEQGKKVSYISQQGKETDRIEIGSDGFYRILEKNPGMQEYFDARPIHCILVAIDKYPQAPLDYCKEDMKLFKDYLEKYFLSFQQEARLVELYDEQATWKNLKQSLEHQVQKKDQYSTAIFVFSGHGVERSLNLFDQEISISCLQEYFQKIDTKRVLWVIDSCHSGALAQKQPDLKRKSKGAFLSQEKLFPSSTPYSFMHCFVGKGKALLCSSLPGEESKDGVFLRAVLSHLGSLEESTSLSPVINKIHERIQSYNRLCRPENILPMTPFLKLYGDFQIAVINP